jgi:siroheme decarboxylase
MNTVTFLSTPLQRRILDEFQHNLPLSPTPYADMAQHLGVTEAEVLAALTEMNLKKIISRIGPVFKPHCIGTSTLAAMAVPPLELNKIAALISALPEVNHNYEREHHFNLWFVLTATDELHLQRVIDVIEHATGIHVMSLPMEQEFHIDLGFRLKHGGGAHVSA